MKICSLDFETSVGKTVHGPTFRDPNNDIYTIIAGYSENDVYIKHNVNGFKRKMPLGIKLDTYDLIIGHNLGFDLAYIWHDEQLKQFILRGGKIWDTQVAEYLLTGQQHQFSSLAELQLKHLGEKEKPSRISSLYNKGIGADKIVNAAKRCRRLFSLYEYYCHTDGTTPIKIYKKQIVLAKKLNMLPIIEMYNKYLLSLINMSVTGIVLDKIKCEKTLKDFNEKHYELLGKAVALVQKYWNDKRLPPFNINSNDHKSAVLFGGNIKIVESVHEGFYKNGNPKYRNRPCHIWVDGFKVPPSISYPAKKQGFYSTDDKVMRKISEKTKNPELKEYCFLQKEAAMYKKAATTYCQAFLDRCVNDRLLPNFNNTLTSTGRLSSSAPNLQNVSKRNKFGKDLHSLFIAPKGWKCVQIDFSQLEIWVLAMLSKDALLTQHLLEGIDLHIVRLQYYNKDKTYEELYKLCKIDKDPYWDKQRTFAKTVSYQMAYGAMPKKVTESTGLDLEIVETIFNEERNTYLDASCFGDIVREMACQNVEYSKGINIPNNQKKGIHGSRIHNGLELLPIFDNNGNIMYNEEHVRKIGFYTSPTGKRYGFLENGRLFKGRVNAAFSFTQPKNFPMQGTAADIQGMTTAVLLPILLQKSDKIQMINEVHDSKWFYVREDVLEPCLKWLKDVIEDVPKLMKQYFNLEVAFKFPVEIEVGDNFGDMEKYKFN